MSVYGTFASNVFTPTSVMTPMALCMKTGAPDRGAREKSRLARYRRLWRSLSYDPGLAWHNVPLKQPGSVPGGAGVGGWSAGLFGDPGK